MRVVKESARDISDIVFDGTSNTDTSLPGPWNLKVWTGSSASPNADIAAKDSQRKLLFLPLLSVLFSNIKGRPNISTCKGNQRKALPEPPTPIRT
jgi:hypothetical protein